MLFCTLYIIAASLSGRQHIGAVTAVFGMGIRSMLFLPLLSLLCAVFYYLKAFKTGLAAKRWAMAGLIFGPLLLPLFLNNLRLARIRTQGFNPAFLRA